MRAVTRKRVGNVVVPLIVVFINIMIAVYPREALAAAREGLTLWFNNILPSLLPFVVGVNVLSGLGAVHFAGVMLEPVTRVLFRAPGCGGFALVSGLMSGYPLGAKVTAELRADGSLRQDEAQRLAGFANNSGPLFIIGVVGAGMFGNVLAGYYIYAVHLISALAVGLVFRGYGGGEPYRETGKGKRLMPKAYRAMEKARQGKSVGQVLGTGVNGAMETMLIVGGYVILFSVIMAISEKLGLFNAAEDVLRRAAAQSGNAGASVQSGNANTTLRGILMGLLEITNGIRTISQGATSKSALAAAAGIISWGGLSIHAQSISFISKTDIKIAPYLLGKALHGALAALMCSVLYPVYEFFVRQQSTDALPVASVPGRAGVLDKLMSSSRYFAVSCLVIAAAAAVLSILRRVLRAVSK